MFAAYQVWSNLKPFQQEFMIFQSNKHALQYSQGIYIPGQSPPPSSKKLILPGQEAQKSSTEVMNEPILTHSYSALTGQEPTLTEAELISKEADLKTKIQIAGIGNEEIPHMLLDIARECFKLGQIEKSLIYNQQLMIYLSSIKKGDTATQKLFIQTFQNIGQLLIRIGDPANGLKFIDQAIERMKTLSGSGHIDMAKLYNDQGLCNLYLEDFDKAISSYQDAMALRKQLYGEKRELDTEDAIILNNLGVAQNYAEKFTEAVQTFRVAMAIYEKFSDEKNILYINSLENLGFSLGGTGEMGQQIEFLKKALKLKIEHHPTRIIEMANTQLQIGQSYEKLGQIDEAEQYYQQSLQTRKNIYGDKISPDMGQTLLQIGQVKHAKSDLQTAKKYYNQALPHFDKKTTEHALVLNLLGAIHDTEGNFNDALEFHQKALQINQQLHGLKAYQNLVSMHNLSSVYEKIGNIDQALHYKEQIADIIVKSKRNTDMDIISVLQEVSNLQRKAQKYESALETNNQILDLAKKVYGDEEQNTAQVYQQLGEIYFELQNKEKSVENLQKCIDIRKKFLPESSNLIQDVKKQIESAKSEQ